MTCKVARCFRRSRALPPLLTRSVLRSHTESAGCLLLFILQMAPLGVRGQSDNHIRKHTSSPEQHFGRTSAWPCCIWQVNVCDASTLVRSYSTQLNIIKRLNHHSLFSELVNKKPNSAGWKVGQILLADRVSGYDVLGDVISLPSCPSPIHRASMWTAF